jgi:hypothetical protein
MWFNIFKIGVELCPHTRGNTCYSNKGTTHWNALGRTQHTKLRVIPGWTTVKLVPEDTESDQVLNLLEFGNTIAIVCKLVEDTMRGFHVLS